MEAHISCPTLSELEHHVWGDQVESVSKHVESCTTCITRLAELHADKDLAEELRSARAHAHPDGHMKPLPQIEGYDLEGEIHRGGQGIVYRAFQRSTKRTVAIKLLLDGAFASERQRLRFEREVELAASLDHPGIVAVHDSGVTKDGRSYFVMEYIDGVPATEYTGPRDRVDLSIEICEAVEAAHLRGVLHRDLKPANILIDGSAQPHVLDFGLAAMATQSNDDEPRLTRTGEFMGTLAYASPEHVTGDPNLVDVRSDVYALGVILYELFTGRLPYSVEGPPLEAIRAVLEAEPLSIRRNRTPDGRSIDGELETVIFTALSKEKGRRYPSAGALAGDLRRYRDGEPLWARHDSLAYVLTKTLRRYRWRAMVLTALFFGAIGSSIAIGVLYKRAESQRDQAVRQGGRASEISAFFKGALESISPNQARGRTVAVREVLDEAALRLERDSLQYPEAELELRLSVGNAYRSLGLFLDALPHVERAAQLAYDVYGAEHPETGRALFALGDVQLEVSPQGQALASYAAALVIFEASGHVLEQGRTEGRMARSRLREGDLDLAEQHRQRSHRLLERAQAGGFAATSSLFDWATLSHERGDLERAEDRARECIARTRASDHVELNAFARQLLGLILEDQDRHAEARDELELAVESHVILFGDVHPQTIMCSTELALVILRGEGRDAASGLIEACLTHRDVLVACRDSFGSRGLHNLGLLAQIAGDFALAEDLQRQALAQVNAIFQQDTYFESIAQANLAWTLCEHSKFEEAEEHARASASVLRRLFGAGSPREARVLGLLGWIAVGRGHWSKAVEHGRRALAGAQLEAGSLPHIVALTDLGSFLYFAGETDEALERLAEAVRLLRTSGLEPDARWARALSPLGEALRDSYRLDEAEVVLREALDLRERFLGEHHAYTAQTMNALAMVLWFQQDPSDEALGLLERALESLRPLGENHTYTAWVLNNLGAWHRVREGDLDRALEYVSEGVAHGRRSAAHNHPLLAINLANLALVHSLRGDHDDALPLLEEAYETLAAVRGPDHPQTVQVLGLLVAECEALGEGELAERYRALHPVR